MYTYIEHYLNAQGEGGGGGGTGRNFDRDAQYEGGNVVPKRDT